MNKQRLIVFVAVGLALCATATVGGDRSADTYLMEFQIVVTNKQQIEIQSSAITSDGNLTTATEVSLMRIGDMTLDFDAEFLWDGRSVPPEDAGITVLSMPQLIVPAGEKATVRSGSSGQVQFLERQEGDCYKIQSLPPEFAPGVFIEVVPRIAQPDDPPNTVRLDLSLEVTVVTTREILPGVNLDVGRPNLIKQESYTKDHRFRLDRWNLMTTHLSRDLANPNQETLVVFLRVSRTNQS